MASIPYVIGNLSVVIVAVVVLLYFVLRKLHKANFWIYWFLTVHFNYLFMNWKAHGRKQSWLMLTH